MDSKPQVENQHSNRNIGEKVDLGGDFCVVCGADPPLFYDRMCEKCTMARVTPIIVPETVQHFQCARCGLHEVGGRWVDLPLEELYEDFLNRVLVIHEEVRGLDFGLAAEVIDDRNTRLHLQFSGEVSGIPFSEEHQLLARRSNSVCVTCGRIAGNYYEATVQLRSAGRKLNEGELAVLRGSLSKLLEDMPPDPMFFISSESSVVGGYDVVLGSKGLARSWARYLVRNWGGQIKETNTVVGMRDGMDVTRLTVLYRKPGYDLGDVVRWRKQIWRINAWTGDGAMVSRIDRAERTGATWRDLEKLIVLATQSELQTVDLITQDSSVGEFLDPVKWTPICIKLPYNHEGNSIRVAKIDDEWIALPLLSVDKKEDE